MLPDKHINGTNSPRGDQHCCTGQDNILQATREACPRQTKLWTMSFHCSIDPLWNAADCTMGRLRLDIYVVAPCPHSLSHAKLTNSSNGYWFYPTWARIEYWLESLSAVAAQLPTYQPLPGHARDATRFHGKLNTIQAHVGLGNAIFHTRHAIGRSWP